VGNTKKDRAEDGGLGGFDPAPAGNIERWRARRPEDIMLKEWILIVETNFPDPNQTSASRFTFSNVAVTISISARLDALSME
jgi:hypothetical protein